jgi:hypothetical protein
LRSIAAVLADIDPTLGASSAAAVAVPGPEGKNAAIEPVATAPTAAADAITEVRTDGRDGGGGPAMS